MGKSVALSDADYVVIGRRYGSNDVADEAVGAAARWERDVAVLAEYGFGAVALAAFNAEVAAHKALRESRPDAVAARIVSVGARNDAVTTAWVWVDTVTSLLGTLARKDKTLATQLDQATPHEDTGLEAAIGALKGLVAENLSALPADSSAAARVAEADAVATALQTLRGAAATAKAAPIQDTEALDLADGQIYVVIKDLNVAGRKAIRNGKLKAKRSEYTFKQLRRTAEKPPGTPEPPPA